MHYHRHTEEPFRLVECDSGILFLVVISPTIKGELQNSE